MRSTTNPIGYGTRNIAVNLPADGRDIIGRVANRLDISIGRLFRDSVITHLEKVSPLDASELKRVWREYYRGVGSASMALLFCGVLIWSWIHSDEPDLRRARRSRTEHIEEWHIEEES